MVVRMTKSLSEARNDTGRIAYCGPTVISAITGYPVSRIETLIHEYRGDPKAAEEMIVGTHSHEVAAALAIFGLGMDQTEDYLHLEKKARPTVWQWMQRPRSPWSFFVLGINKGKEGHWICIKGAQICDTFTKGKWLYASVGPHRGCRIMMVYQVKRVSEFPELGANRQALAGPAAPVLRGAPLQATDTVASA